MNELSLDKLRQALDYIQEHLGEDISLEAIANYLNISQYHFSHLFKESMGISPYQYVLQQRVERAKQLLKQRELTIAEITVECGFANQAHLFKHFHKFLGMSPTKYRSYLID
ncbi:helix-turn-helix domain-containing protein [Aerosakkonemataceae cyanobacterium BLCC-F50]|uniref:Helix-turn-helix domain-containing protein n=1 Tax=Floridaenema flaviceps BLCC-F50 TaxID=3153642 RepID=A0ABV4XPP7_9CYAN